MSLVRGAQSILCPRSYGPGMAPEHELHVRLQNAAYEAAERDDGGDEMSEPADRQYSAITYGKDNEYGMRAYVESVSGLADGYGPVTVRAAWLRCQICGLVLPGEYRTVHEQIGGKW